MKVALCVHGYPPELVGGTERSARQLARGLALAGHDVLVLAGTCEASGGSELRRSEVRDGAVRVVRLHRPDLYFDHWQKSRSVRVNGALRELLREFRPDVVHVLHWLRLSRELVLGAAREGIPCVVSLNDSWISCPLTFRVDPRTRSACERSLSAMACISCAGTVPPRTPWVPMEAAFLEFAKREADVKRELELARVLLAPTRLHAERLAGFIDGLDAERVRVAPPAAPLGRGEASRPLLDGPLRLLSFGALSELKGVDLLVEAVADPRLAGRVELLLAGREERAGWLSALLARHPAARVVRLGDYAAEDLFDHEHAVGRAASTSHAFVAASRAPESFALVLDEARALGLPAVLPRLGAFLARAEEGSGATFFEPGDRASLARVLARLVDAPEELAALRAGVPRPTTPEEVLAAHLAAYEEARAAGPPALEEAGGDEWYEQRMALFAEEEWDRGLSQANPRELGLEP